MAWGLYKANVNDYGLLVGHCYGNVIFFKTIM